MVGHALRAVLVVLWAAILAFPIALIGQGIWTGLLVLNLSTSPRIPWSVIVMIPLLWALWKYLGGWGWPRRTSAVRRRLLRASPVPGQVFAWAVLAGGLSIFALAGCWIVMAQLVHIPGSPLPDVARYPLLTTILAVGMGSLISPLLEQAGFWGYGQAILARTFPGAAAILITSGLYILLPHPPLGGPLWPRLIFYFLTGITFGVMAYLTDSILPGLLVHILGILAFFTLVWPRDGERLLVSQGGADAWFWLHVGQSVLFAALAVMAFRRLAWVTNRAHAAALHPITSD